MMNREGIWFSCNKRGKKTLDRNFLLVYELITVVDLFPPKLRRKIARLRLQSNGFKCKW